MSNSHSLRQSHRLPQRPSTELQVSLSALRSQPSTLSTLAERFSKWGLFSALSTGKAHRIINCEKQRRGRKALLCVSPSSRAVSRFSKPVYRIIRGKKQQKQKCVKSRKVLLINKAAAKLCCRRRSLYSTKTRNQGRVVFPSGNLHPSPDSSFLF